MEEINCDWCGSATEKYQSNITENNFCSRDCYNSWDSKEKSGNGNPMWNDAKIDVSCELCSENFEQFEESVTEHSFCSNECRLEWFGDEYGDDYPVMKGEDNPQWSGGYENYYGSNWNEERRNALSSAGYKCELCEMSRSAHYETHGFDLDVHHRIPINAFDNAENANFQNNLVVCCRKCHQSTLEANPVPHNEIRAPT